MPCRFGFSIRALIHLQGAALLPHATQKSDTAVRRNDDEATRQQVRASQSCYILTPLWLEALRLTLQPLVLLHSKDCVSLCSPN